MEARHADADGAHNRLDVLHRVIDGQSGAHRTTRRVNVERDILIRIGALEMQELRDDGICRSVRNLFAKEDDTVSFGARAVNR